MKKEKNEILVQQNLILDENEKYIRQIELENKEIKNQLIEANKENQKFEKEKKVLETVKKYINQKLNEMQFNNIQINENLNKKIM